MTGEETIKILNSLKQYYNDKNEDSYVGFDDEDNEAIDMAINALEFVEEVQSMFNANTDDVLKLMLKALKGESEGWIPCSERLPEKYKEVIVTDVETIDAYLSRYIGDGYWECDNGSFKDRIIAWMPLPHRYELQESEE